MRVGGSLDIGGFRSIDTGILFDIGSPLDTGSLLDLGHTDDLDLAMSDDTSELCRYYGPTANVRLGNIISTPHVGLRLLMGSHSAIVSIDLDTSWTTGRRAQLGSDLALGEMISIAKFTRAHFDRGQTTRNHTI